LGDAKKFEKGAADQAAGLTDDTPLKDTAEGTKRLLRAFNGSVGRTEKSDAVPLPARTGCDND
jgi:hypothetical protein